MKDENENVFTLMYEIHEKQNAYACVSLVPLRLTGFPIFRIDDCLLFQAILVPFKF